MSAFGRKQWKFPEERTISDMGVLRRDDDVLACSSSSYTSTRDKLPSDKSGKWKIINPNLTCICLLVAVDSGKEHMKDLAIFCMIQARKWSYMMMVLYGYSIFVDPSQRKNPNMTRVDHTHTHY